MNKLGGIAILLTVLVLIDVYVYQAALAISRDWSAQLKNVIRYGYWGIALLSWLAILWYAFGNPFPNTRFPVRTFVLVGIVAIYFSKIFSVVFVLIDDLQRGVRWVVRWFAPGSAGNPGAPIPRSEFLARTAAVAATVPFGLMTYGIISGAHDYRVRKVKINLPNLPKAFDGIRIGQISDIHSGSFFNKKAVNGGVEMFHGQKPDVIFFTGDLVNNQSTEIRDYFDVFNKLKAPLGVFSITGNHDYGDYREWSSVEEKKKNFQDLIEAHRLLGYDLLLNSTATLNWAVKRSRSSALRTGARDASLNMGSSTRPVQELKTYPLSCCCRTTRPIGTHRFDLATLTSMLCSRGIRTGFNSASKWEDQVESWQYVYKQWGGLYQEQDQRLYVNRGFGFIGYPGRIGMPPELTIFELKRS